MSQTNVCADCGQARPTGQLWRLQVPRRRTAWLCGPACAARWIAKLADP